MTAKRHIPSLLFLTAVALAFFYPVLDGGLLLTERDLSMFFIPPRHLWVRAISEGSLPLWNPYSYSGAPLLATLQPGVLYPINALLLILPFDAAFNWTVIIHFILAGAFAYLLLQDLGAGRPASVIAGVTLMLSGYIFSVHNVISTLFTASWAPLLLLLYLRALRRGSFSYSILSGIVTSMMFLAGGIEVLFAALLLLFILTLAPGVVPAKDWGPYAPVKKRLILYPPLIAVFLLLSSVQLLPFLELAGHSIRSGGLSYHEATTWSFGLKDFIQFLVPDPYGYFLSDEKYWANQSWLKTVYLGAVPFILSAFFFLEGRGRLLPFMATGLLFLAIAMGRNNAFYPLLYGYAPFFSKIRYPVKFLFIPFLFVSISAGLGYESLRGAMDERRKDASRAVVALLILSTAAALAFGLLHFYGAPVEGFLKDRGIDYPAYNHARVNIFNTKRLLVFFIIISMSIYLALRSRKALKALPFIVITVLTFDLFFAHSGFYAMTEGLEYHGKGPSVDYLLGDRERYFRVFVTPRTRDITAEVPPNAARGEPINLDKERVSGYNLLHGVFEIGGVEVMRVRGYEAVFNIMATQKKIDSTNILAMLNVKYVISIPPVESKEFRLRKILGANDGGGGGDGGRPGMRGSEIKRLEKKNTLKIYENLNYLPRFFLVDGYTVLKSGAEFSNMLSSKSFDPGKVVLLEKDPWDGKPAMTDGPKRGAERGRKRVEVLDYGYNSIRLRVFAQTPSILVASESYYPGWKAFVNGVEAEVLKANHVLRAVALDEGVHEVIFSYEPGSFRYGAFVSGFTAAALVLFGFTRAVRAWRKTE